MLILRSSQGKYYTHECKRLQNEPMVNSVLNGFSIASRKCSVASWMCFQGLLNNAMRRCDENDVSICVKILASSFGSLFKQTFETSLSRLLSLSRLSPLLYAKP